MKRRTLLVGSAACSLSPVSAWAANPIFDELKKNYPPEKRVELYKLMGPEWEKLTDNPNFQNTCAIKMSLAFLRSGFKIDKKYQEAKYNGEPVIVKVKTFGNFVKEVFGEFTWGLSKEPGKPFNLNDVPVKKGIIVYHADWANASGHFDLWDGVRFVGDGNTSDIKDGFDVALWYMT